MEPVTIGLAAAALLATKFGEGVAQNAGESVWGAVKGVLTRKFRADDEVTQALESAEIAPNRENLTILTRSIVDASSVDEQFRIELAELLNKVPHNSSLTNINAQAYDNAKQAIISGGTSIGTLNI